MNSSNNNGSDLISFLFQNNPQLTQTFFQMSLQEQQRLYEADKQNKKLSRVYLNLQQNNDGLQQANANLQAENNRLQQALVRARNQNANLQEVPMLGRINEVPQGRKCCDRSCNIF